MSTLHVGVSLGAKCVASCSDSRKTKAEMLVCVFEFASVCMCDCVCVE